MKLDKLIYKLIKWIPVIMGCIGLIQLALGEFDSSIIFFIFMFITYGAL